MAPAPLRCRYTYVAELEVPPSRKSSQLKRMQNVGSPRTLFLQITSETNGEAEMTPTPTTDGAGRDAAAREPTEPVLGHPQEDVSPFERARSRAPVGISRKLRFATSVTSTTVTSRGAGLKHGAIISPPALPDFFSHAISQMALENPTISHQLLKYTQSRLCSENMEFLGQVNRYLTLLNGVSKQISEIHEGFLSSRAPTQINIGHQSLIKVAGETKAAVSATLPSLESLFAEVQLEVERLLYDDVYPGFVRHQMSLSARRALGVDQSKFAGLGDCFVLTDPTKADNPIVFASDGFVAATGYSRQEIMPRNCRFLQGQQTDQSSVKSLRMSIARSEELVEFILNYKVPTSLSL